MKHYLKLGILILISFLTVQAINSSNHGGEDVEANTYSGKERYNVWFDGISGGVLTGTVAVCNGEAYHYTYTPPGGHQPGYTYRWTMPNSTWYHHTSYQNTILAGPQGSGTALPGQLSVEINTGSGWVFGGSLYVYPSYSCP